MKRAKTILGIESSCDETSVALLEVLKDDFKVVFHETASQIAIHERYGGVVPEVAARTHVAEIVSLLERSDVFGSTTPDAIAVTRGPGLATALRVGIEAARTLAYAWDVPIIGVNHLEGHLASVWLDEENRTKWDYPILALLVSGGHTELVVINAPGKYKVLGRTRDDAAGEAFDKTAKIMGLGYPGGPAISKRALDGDPNAFDFPRPMIHDPSFDFSFSGLKTAVRQTWEKLPDKEKKNPQMINHLAASLQAAIVESLIAKTKLAMAKIKPKAVTVVGGVSANAELRAALQHAVAEFSSSTFFLSPPMGVQTDNAAMIAAAGAWKLAAKKTDDWKKLEAKPEWDL